MREAPVQDPRLDPEDGAQHQLGELSHDAGAFDSATSTKWRESGQQSDQK